MSAPSAKDQALALKEEGNKAFRSKNWQEAYDKYTEAIKLDNKNVVYYTNRAAALQEMRRYVAFADLSAL
jgi:serine/threonine-protein phosphatase 5